MKVKCSWVVVVTCIFGSVSLGSAQCSDECCYQYDRIPGNLTCNPQEGNVAVWCRINAPNDSIASLRVKWYRSDITGDNAEQVTSIQFDPRTLRAVINRGLVRLSAHLMLHNFSENSGYYWCQIVVNDTCLQPSPPGLIQVVEENCSTSTTFAGITSPVCAAALNPRDPDCLNLVVDTTTTPTASTNSNSISDTSILSSTATSAMPGGSRSFCGENIELSYCHGIVAGSPIIAAMNLIMFSVVLPVCLYVRRRRRRSSTADKQEMRSVSNMIYEEIAEVKVCKTEINLASLHEHVQREETHEGTYSSLKIESMDYESIYTRPATRGVHI